ncbi:hypothetical protein HK102_013580 [Quaeritorhiza haematococci]|nr:hypothetical protein HK102_013580 [Quaeritorhiza haematococci]
MEVLKVCLETTLEDYPHAVSGASNKSSLDAPSNTNEVMVEHFIQHFISSMLSQRDMISEALSSRQRPENRASHQDTCLHPHCSQPSYPQESPAYSNPPPPAPRHQHKPPPPEPEPRGHEFHDIRTWLALAEEHSRWRKVASKYDRGGTQGNSKLGGKLNARPQSAPVSRGKAGPYISRTNSDISDVEAGSNLKGPKEAWSVGCGVVGVGVRPKTVAGGAFVRKMA